jgi:hypothetical protein
MISKALSIAVVALAASVSCQVRSALLENQPRFLIL